jgi:acyl-CoA hydrolase
MCINQCCGFRHDLKTGTYQHTHSAIMTFVAINRFGRPYPGLPNLFDPDRAQYCVDMKDTARQRRDFSSRWKKFQDEVDTFAFISKDQVKVFPKKEEVKVKDTEVVMRTHFLPKHLNVNNTLFGGDLLNWMVQGSYDPHVLAFYRPDNVFT